MEELTLGANLPLTDLKRLQWKTKDYTTGKAFILPCLQMSIFSSPCTNNLELIARITLH